MLKYKGRNLDPPPSPPTDVRDIVLNDLTEVTDIVLNDLTEVTDIVLNDLTEVTDIVLNGITCRDRQSEALPPFPSITDRDRESDTPSPLHFTSHHRP